MMSSILTVGLSAIATDVMVDTNILRSIDETTETYTSNEQTSRQMQMSDIVYETKDENTIEKTTENERLESDPITEEVSDTEPIVEAPIESTSEHIVETPPETEEYIPTITIDRTESVVDEYRYIISEEEFAEFVRVVEAEVTGTNPFNVSYEEAFKCKLHVAQVILNRVESDLFPDTVHDVIHQRNAFTPLLDGRYYTVDISQVTIDACRAALLSSTPDTTQGCVFFSSGTTECSYGYYVFTDEVGHSFFQSYYND